MAKSRSGYKRGRYQAPEGVKIEIRTEEAYRLLSRAARSSSCTLGQWAEAQLKYAMSGEPYIGHVGRNSPATLAKKPRSFQISEDIFEEIARRHGEGGARPWIASALPWMAMIEARLVEAKTAEPDRFCQF